VPAEEICVYRQRSFRTASRLAFRTLIQPVSLGHATRISSGRMGPAHEGGSVQCRGTSHTGALDPVGAWDVTKADPTERAPTLEGEEADPGFHVLPYRPADRQAEQPTEDGIFRQRHPQWRGD